ncbi:MAG: hypothetical protein LKJ17_11905 [Oscillospiraceae bacterium]|jgi:hypothetical protein|nr:hypothetical protein [Oscillospiraceae bacterium]
MTSRTSKILYIVYLIFLPLFIIGIQLVIRQANIISSMTYSTFHHYISFLLTLLLGVLLGADFWMVKNSQLTKKSCCYFKLADLALLIIVYEAVLHGLFSPLFQKPVSGLLLAAGYQLITAIYFCAEKKSEEYFV